MSKTFKWRPGTQFKISAKVAGERVEAIKQKRGGEITPTDVLEDARSPKSPLHPAFEWSDSKAAHAWRLDQARSLLGALIIEIRIRQDKPRTPMRAMVHVIKNDKPRYVGLHDAISDKGMRAQVIERAWRELESWAARYQQYSELAKLVEAVEHELRFRPKKKAA
jgi:hypothetical protein